MLDVGLKCSAGKRRVGRSLPSRPVSFRPIWDWGGNPQIKAPFLHPDNYSAHARSCSLYGRTTAVTLGHVELVYLCVCVHRRRSLSNTRSTCRGLILDLSILCHASWSMSSAMPGG